MKQSTNLGVENLEKTFFRWLRLLAADQSCCLVHTHVAGMAGLLPSIETLQLVVLHALEAHGSISDSRSLRLALPTSVETDDAIKLAPLEQAESAPIVGPSVEAQNALKSALDSLATREVSLLLAALLLSRSPFCGVSLGDSSKC